MPYGYTNDRWVAMSPGQRRQAQNSYNARTHDNHMTYGKATEREYGQHYAKYTYSDGTIVRIVVR